MVEGRVGSNPEGVLTETALSSGRTLSSMVGFKPKPPADMAEEEEEEGAGDKPEQCDPVKEAAQLALVVRC